MNTRTTVQAMRLEATWTPSEDNVRPTMEEANLGHLQFRGGRMKLSLAVRVDWTSMEQATVVARVFEGVKASLKAAGTLHSYQAQPVRVNADQALDMRDAAAFAGIPAPEPETEEAED